MTEQWKVSWSMWPLHATKECRVEKVYDNAQAAQKHMLGLLTLRTDHKPRPCSEHVWDIQIERREIAEWTESN